MANLSEDIQSVGSDTRPPMLDRTDSASWQQCIRLYCRGKENEGRHNRGQGNNTRGAGAASYRGAQNRVGYANPALNVDNVFQADDYDTFDLDVDEAPTAQTMFMSVGSDTRPPMLDRTDSASWQQCIRLYCRGKENEVNILKSIDEGPFRMGTLRETLTEGTEGTIWEVHLDYLKHLKESVETLREIVEEAKVKRPLDRSLASACLYTKHSQELLEYVIGTCLKDFNQRDKNSSGRLDSGMTALVLSWGNSAILIWKMHSGSIHVMFEIQMPVVVPAKHLDSNNNWGSNSPNSPSLSVFKCRSNFMKKFIGTARFGNDCFGAIMGQFCNSDMEDAFRKHSCYVRDTDDVELIKGSRGYNLYTIFIEDMMKSSSICLLSKASKTKSWL
nr:integrase, catalytic region, zinc finger, CCHC-type, peptidase aspartic, catalytic [Tanacetum cinerariifolium]